MAYKSTAPQPTDNLSDSQNDLLNNFQVLNSYFSINHYPFAANTANNGKHKFCEMPIGSLPVGLVANEATIYAKSATSIGASTEANLWMTPDAGSKEYQLTRCVSDAVSYPKFSANPGWTFLPGGLLMQYGAAISNTSSPNGSVTFPIAFSATPYSIQLCALENSNSRRIYHIDTLTSTGFTCYIQDNSGSSVANTFYWVCIGK